MYHPIGIQKLSQPQISKMLRGERVRVKHGAHHKLHVSEEQHKKIMKAHQKGCGVTIQMDPYQRQHHAHLKGHGEGEGHRVHRGHGDGFKEDYLDKIGNAFSSTWNRPASPQEKQQLRGMLDVQNEIASNIPVLGQVWNPVSNALANKYGVGEGVRHRGRPRKHPVHKGHGDGFFEDLGRELLPVAKELGTAFIKKKAGLGEGMHKRRGRPAKKHMGMALYPAGYGEGEGEGEGHTFSPMAGPHYMHRGMGEGVRHRGRPRKHPVHKPKVASHKGYGEGLKKHHKRGRKGKGPIGSALGSIFGDMLPF